uniref:AAA+ ATPase domain-containing protein n=1 Tax=Pundamilia nyererei TaxID=303518 RepID=A0A3B4FVE4_9CICH
QPTRPSEDPAFIRRVLRRMNLDTTTILRYKANKTILLVGETGAGKSTLINTLINYTIGVKWEDKVWFQIVEEEKKTQTESQTSDVIVYEIFGFEDETLPYSLTIIDTPGYGNTKGTEHDDIISERLLDLFQSEDGVHEVHAVGLVMKATDNRMSDRPIYVFDSVMSLLEKDLEKNIVALITHSNGRRPKSSLQALEDSNIKCARNEKNQPLYFLFDNCQHEDRTEEEEFLTTAYKKSERGIREFTMFLEKTSPQILQKTVEVLNERIRLASCIQNLQEKIRQGKVTQTKIRSIQEALKKHDEEIKKNEKFNIEVTENYKERSPIDCSKWWIFERAVCCTVCEVNCCYSKAIWSHENCEVMKDGRCTVCLNRCPASKHEKQKWAYVDKTRKFQKTDTEMKEKYESNKSESEKKKVLLENVEKEINQLTAEKLKLLDESYQHLVRLEQIALKADSASTIVHLDFLIEEMKEKGDTEKVQKLEEMRSRVGEETKAALQYMCAKLTVAENVAKDQEEEQHSYDMSAGNPDVHLVSIPKN